jgi:hypothetical protein
MLLALPAAAHAASGGIGSNVFGSTGCPACHSGGLLPSVVLSGPTVVTPGNTYTFSFTIWGNPLQAHAGFNVAAPDGVLSLGGPYVDGTRTIIGAGGRTEITHDAPQPGVGLFLTVDFSFQWTAPADFTSVVITAWGNAVNLSGWTDGDNAASESIEVFSDAAQTPTDTPTPTPTPLPCTNATPLEPALLGDADQRRCQAALAKGGHLYFKQHMKAAQKCVKAFQRGTLIGNPIALCVGTSTVPPTNAVVSGKLALAEAKLRSLLSARCTEPAVAALDLCAATENGLEDCLLQALRQRVLDAILSQYGALVPITDDGTAKCQTAVAKMAGNYLSARQRASQKCLNLRNQQGTPATGAAALCIGAVTGGLAQSPGAPAAAEKIAGVLGKLSEKINAACTDEQVDALPACGDTRAELIECLTCSQTSTVLGLLGDLYGGTP